MIGAGGRLKTTARRAWTVLVLATALAAARPAAAQSAGCVADRSDGDSSAADRSSADRVATYGRAANSSGAATQPAPAADSSGVTFLPRSAFHMGAEHISSDDPRYVWDANFGGEVDLVDYGVGRATFLANYQVILGDEFHAFDPNQGNYILAASVSARAGGSELSMVFHHESRHLSDRAKRQPVDWNMLGARIRRRARVGIVEMDARADLRGVILKSYVDYRWELDADLRNLYRVAPRMAVISDVDLRMLGVDESQGRGRQTGVRVEGGVRFEGRGGAVELFVAGERRVDPYPLEFGTESWLTAGFRLLSR